MFFSRGSLGSIEFAFTDREGGLSTGPYSSLNLGASSTDAESDSARRVAGNLNALAEAFEVQRVLTMTQVHGAGIAFIDKAFIESGNTEAPVADAMITDQVGLGLIVRAADCTPIILADPHARLIAVVHAGRKGLAMGVAPATIRAMREHGATRIQAWLGPRVCGKCYELPAQLVEDVSALVPEARASTRLDTPSLDVGKGLVAQLKDVGADVTDLGEGVCTMEDQRFFSYRRQGKASGRQGGIVVLRPVGDAP